LGILISIVIVSWPPEPTCSTPLGVGLEAGGVKNPVRMIALQTLYRRKVSDLPVPGGSALLCHCLVPRL